MPIVIPDSIKTACQTLAAHGFQAYLVGGAVRDSLLGLQPTDWDIVTDARPGEIERLFSKTIPTGKQFGTITVILADKAFEITTMRLDGPYSDGRHPDRVEFSNRLEVDLARRDFTINAIAYDPFQKRIIDPFSGVVHLRKKILAAVGDPERRFAEDPLRMLRLARFKAVLGFRIKKQTELAVQARWIEKVSPERIQVELNRMLLGRELLRALKFFYRSGLMERIIPELAAGAGISAGKSHPYDLVGHAAAAAHFAAPSLPIRWAALLHDIGKTTTPKREHAEIGARLAAQVLTRLRAENKLISHVKALIKHHMFAIHPHSSDAAIRSFMSRVGTDLAFDLIELRKADMAGMNVDPRRILAFADALRNRFNGILAQDSALTLKDLAVDGRSLMKNLKLEQGPLVGQILHYLLERVLAAPSENEPARLLELAENYLKTLR